jgi:hypothetical protein
VSARPVEPGGIDLDADDVQTRSSEHLGDARSHRPQPDHADTGERAHHLALLGLAVLDAPSLPPRSASPGT